MFLEATEMHRDVLQGDSVENIDPLFTNEDEFICLGKRHRNCWQEKKVCVRSYSIPSFGGKDCSTEKNASYFTSAQLPLPLGLNQAVHFSNVFCKTNEYLGNPGFTINNHKVGDKY